MGPTPDVLAKLELDGRTEEAAELRQELLDRPPPNRWYQCGFLIPSETSLGDCAEDAADTDPTGHGLGVFVASAPGDACERRRLLCLLALGMAMASTAAVIAPSFAWLLAAWFALGLVALIPALLPAFLTALTPVANQGRMLGIVLSGQFTGLLLSRSVSGVVARLWGWRAIYGMAAMTMLGVAFLLRRSLPISTPSTEQSYGQLMASQLALWRRHARLRSSCLSQALLFGSFMALWSAVALHLAEPPWHFGPGLIGSFGLVGLASILAAPTIGRQVDLRGPDRIVLAGVICAGAGVPLLRSLPLALPAMVLGLMAVDLGVQGGFVAYQARIFAIDPQARSRMSGQLRRDLGKLEWLGLERYLWLCAAACGPGAAD